MSTHETSTGRVRWAYQFIKAYRGRPSDYYDWLLQPAESRPEDAALATPQPGGILFRVADIYTYDGVAAPSCAFRQQ